MFSVYFHIYFITSFHMLSPASAIGYYLIPFFQHCFLKTPKYTHFTPMQVMDECKLSMYVNFLNMFIMYLFHPQKIFLKLVSIFTYLLNWIRALLQMIAQC